MPVESEREGRSTSKVPVLKKPSLVTQLGKRVLTGRLIKYGARGPSHTPAAILLSKSNEQQLS